MDEFYRIQSVNEYGGIGFSFAVYSLESSRRCNRLIGYDDFNYPLKIQIEKIRRLDQFRVTASYNIEEVFDESNIES